MPVWKLSHGDGIEAQRQEDRQLHAEIASETLRVRHVPCILVWVIFGMFSVLWWLTCPR